MAGALVLVILGVVSAVLFPIFAQRKSDGPTPDLSDMKQLAIGLIMYGADWDDRMPPAESWFDRVNLYIQNEAVAVCDGLDEPGPGQFGHALHRPMAAARLDTLEHPERTVLVLDSMDLSRNAVSDLSQLPRPGRNEGRNTIAYADSHVRYIGIGVLP